MTTPSQYKVSYTAVSQGQHKLHVQVNDREINGSPFTITVYLDPTQLGHPVRINDPRGVTLHDNQVYMCDANNHRIQVFDLNLNFVRSIGSRGIGRGEFNEPWDVKLDTAGNIYVADYNNSRVQVLDNSGHFIRTLGDEGERKLSRPSGLHIADKYVYISDWGSHCIVVYETSGQFVTLFGRGGQNEGEFHWPYCITSCVDGFIHVCDNRVQIF